MTKICTSIEQSQKLMELGIDLNTADMFYAPDANIIVAEPYITKTEGVTLVPAYKGAVPAWSLSALLELMPKKEDDELDLCYGAYNGDGEYVATWACSCKNHFDFGDTQIDAVFKVVCWLLENKKI